MTNYGESLKDDKNADEVLATSGLVVRRLTYYLMRCMRRLVKHILICGIDRISTQPLEAIIYQLVARRVAALLADKELRFLFNLDEYFTPSRDRSQLNTTMASTQNTTISLP